MDAEQKYIGVSVNRLLKVKSLTEREVAQLKLQDEDGDGQVSFSEILKMIERNQDDVRRSSIYKYALFFLLSFSIILIGALCGITYGIVDATRQITSNNEVVVSPSDNSLLSSASVVREFQVRNHHLIMKLSV